MGGIMKLPQDSINYIQKEFDNLKPGDDITLILTDTRDKKKVDIQTTNIRKTSKDKIVDDIKELSKLIHHGKIVIKMNDKGCPEINVINRERFKEENKKTD
jgi:hypothetical protein